MTGEVSPVSGPGGPEMRASHEDRDQVVEQLRVAAGDGRLTAEELDERLELALGARTYRELAVLTADLPAASAGGLTRPTTPPKDLVRINLGSGHTKRDGRWQVPRRMEITLTSGQVRLDFTDAVITHQTLEIDATVRSGHLIITTRPGVIVDADDMSVTSGHIRIRPQSGPAVPEILRVSISGTVRSGHIQARPPRRGLLQWLRREPRN